MNHVFYTCPGGLECVPASEGRSCNYCDGGLSWCVVCQGAEASLPSDCPERRMTNTEQDAVQAGNLDFVDGEWRVTRHANQP